MSTFKTETSLAVCTATSSLSNIIGGTASFMSNMMKHRFPVGFFKDTYISTNLNRLEFRSPNQLKPLMAMSTVYEVEETLMGPTSRNYTTMEFVNKTQKDKNYRIIFQDRDNNITMYAVENRFSLKFNYAFKLQTEMQSWNLVNYLSQNFEPGGMKYLNEIRLPSELPKEFITNICHNFGWDIKDKEDREQLRSYLMKYSLGAISERLNQGTGNMTFMFDYTSNILVKYPDVPTNDKVITGLITKEAVVRYQIATEQWSPSSFILEIENNANLITEGSGDLSSNLAKFDIVVEREIIPKDLGGGMKYLKDCRFAPDFNQTTDVLEMEPIIDNGLINILKDVGRFKIRYDKIFKVALYINNKLAPDETYEFNYNTLELTTHIDKLPGEVFNNESYTVVLYGNLEKINILDEYLKGKKTHDIARMDIY